ncbi:Site-specific recombinase XerD (plasmid) [Shinella sp. WSC3-e]|nr:Site-specific recombinase XerD [Rhizobiaceae bacterium]CAK7262181.1 Site-specific recombinase XerD [Shinella sp. WSC3-e]
MSGPATGSKLRHVDLPGPGDATLDTSPATPPPIADASAALPAHLEQLTNRARGYVEAASSANTRRAYAADWKHFSAWCRRQNLAPLPSDPQVVGLYITACASGTVGRGMKPNPVSTIERRLSAIGWKCAERGMALDRKDRAIATVMADIRNKHAAPPKRGASAGRSDRHAGEARSRLAAGETWLRFAKLAKGPLFRRVTGGGKAVGPDRLNDQEVARLVKKTALAVGVRGDLSEIERAQKFAGHSLRAGLASSAEVDERHVQKQLGHASAEMTRRYQRRRDRFRINLTKAAGL